MKSSRFANGLPGSFSTILRALAAGDIPVLESLDAVFRIQPERQLRPVRSHLAGTGYLNLITNSGPFDLLGSIGAGLGYAELLPHSSAMEIGTGISIRVLELETLIEIKEALAGDKDRAMLPILRQTLEEARKAKGNL
jgi:hypothetical protein